MYFSFGGYLRHQIVIHHNYAIDMEPAIDARSDGECDVNSQPGAAIIATIAINSYYDIATNSDYSYTYIL